MVADHDKVTRLVRTSQGQLDSVLRMIEEDRYCMDVANQLLASQALIRKATREVLRAHMAACVTDAVAAQDAGKQIDELVDIFDKMTR